MMYALDERKITDIRSIVLCIYPNKHYNTKNASVSASKKHRQYTV